jgi:chemotaxis protein MotD
MSSQISTSAPPVKVLHIQLQPAELGTVVVRLSLKHDVLDVEMDASQSGTAHLLQRDREVLLGLLRSSGYLVDGVSVQVAEPDRVLGSAAQHTGNAGSSLSQSPTQSQSSGAQTDGRWADGRGQPEQQAPQRAEKPATEGDAGGSISARGIYV